MDEYIKRDAFIEWLKRIPLIDLSDGRGLCRVIMEDDFKKAIKKMPKSIIVDVAPVVRCKDCKHLMFSDCYGECGAGHLGIVRPDDFCSRGIRKDDPHVDDR